MAANERGQLSVPSSGLPFLFPFHPLTSHNCETKISPARRGPVNGLMAQWLSLRRAWRAPSTLRYYLHLITAVLSSFALPPSACVARKANYLKTSRMELQYKETGPDLQTNRVNRLDAQQPSGLEDACAGVTVSARHVHVSKHEPNKKKIKISYKYRCSKGQDLPQPSRTISLKHPNRWRFLLRRQSDRADLPSALLRSR